MSIGYRNITGLDPTTATSGLSIGSIPGDVGIGPSSAVLTALGSGLPPSDGSISIILYPNGSVASFGTDSNGNISAQMTIVNSGDDKTFAIVGGAGGNITLTNGFWGQNIRSAVPSILGTRGFNIQFSTLALSDFTASLTNTPSNLQQSNASWNPVTDKGSVDLAFSYNNSLAENPVSLGIVRQKTLPIVGVQKLVANIPWDSTGGTGITNYNFTDYIFGVPEGGEGPGTYVYTIIAYKYTPSNLSSVQSSSVTVSFGGSNPDISVTTNLVISATTNAAIVVIGDSSGIYTLVTDKTHDTILILSGQNATLDVAIPQPFIKSAFLG